MRIRVKYIELWLMLVVQKTAFKHVILITPLPKLPNDEPPFDVGIVELPSIVTGE